MSIPKEPADAALFASLIYREGVAIADLIAQLEDICGPVAERSLERRFENTDYYRSEMGAQLNRSFLRFERLVGRDSLPDIKRKTNAVEARYSEAGRRRVNIDPGLLTLENIVLATGKNYSHRIYLRDGIFAEITLLYRDGEYRALEWTYPDYASKEVRDLLNTFRERYKQSLRG